MTLAATIAFVTGRAEPLLDGVLCDIAAQARPDDDLELVVIDALDRPLGEITRGLDPLAHGFRAARVSAPKPNVWQGKHRVTDRDWWAMANARNTAIVLADRAYIAFLDDRCRLGPSWLETVRQAARTRASVLAGSYCKYEGEPGQPTTTHDHRRKLHPTGKIHCGGTWLFGCTFALPTSWAFEVNGLEEGCDGLTAEDYIFGLMLENAGYRIDFVPSLYVMQDRTSGNLTCKGSYVCKDKGVSPRDKSHAALERFGKRTRTVITPDLRALRELVVEHGQPWPLPDRNARDWFDGEPISEMTP